ncbi:YcbK family protein [Azospirillum soli]|uniref:YcbK family protein n=1 Tax=Azospirillum soli TaxID=1304799 RepID=UPI001FEBC51C|nr:DUF882 domain-containing protein [Azospirillum soli]MBP2311576.1 uncharacterized protein YcbK (DUF882 family) [Azospirillum soli]
MMRPFLRLTLPCLLVGGFLSGCASTPAPQSTLGASPRSITLYHPQSGETVSATYWRGDGYDHAALQEISTLFRDRRSGEIAPVDPALVDMLVELRERCGAPADTPVHITSGYRSQTTNVALARSNPYVAENSFHLRGQAADIYIPGVLPRRIADEAAAMQRGGYALYPHSGHVHVDTGPFRTWTPKGGEPRTTPAILEAKATPRAKPAPKAEPRVQVAETKPAPAAKAPGGKPVEIKTVASAAPADLSRVRLVLAQLKDQPSAVPTKDRKKP